MPEDILDLGQGAGKECDLWLPEDLPLNEIKDYLFRSKTPSTWLLGVGLSLFDFSRVVPGGRTQFVCL